MQTVDWVIISGTALFTLFMFFGGVVRHVIALGVLLASIYGAWKFGPLLGDLLSSSIANDFGRSLLSHAIVFVAVIVTGILVSKVVSKLIQISGLTAIDRLLGGVTGLTLSLIMCWMILSAVRIMPFQPPMDQSDWWQNSRLLPVLISSGDLVWDKIKPADRDHSDSQFEFFSVFERQSSQ